jgi:hypothetical protein
MEPQLIAVLALVAVATAYLLRRSIRTWAGTKKGGCGGGCGCARAAQVADPAKDLFIPSDQLTVRKR